jgi:hypothetical protein
MLIINSDRELLAELSVDSLSLVFKECKKSLIDKEIAEKNIIFKNKII